MSRIVDWPGLEGFGAVIKGGPFPTNATNSAGNGAPVSNALVVPKPPMGASAATTTSEGTMFEDFERKITNDPAAAFRSFSLKNRTEAIRLLKEADEEDTEDNIAQKLQQLFNNLTEEQQRKYHPVSNKRVRVQRQGIPSSVFGSEKFDVSELKTQSGIIMKGVDKLYGMGVAVTMAMAVKKTGKTYKYFPEELGADRDVMKSLDQHLLQLQYALWDEKDLGGLTMRVQDSHRGRASSMGSASKGTCKRKLADLIRPKLESLLGGATISWKKLQTGQMKLLGWPLKDANGKDRYPTRFFDLKISEMKSILAVIDGLAVVDQEPEGQHVVTIVQNHIARIIETYEEKHRENKELAGYLLRLKAGVSVAAAADHSLMVPRIPPPPLMPPSATNDTGTVPSARDGIMDTANVAAAAAAAAAAVSAQSSTSTSAGVAAAAAAAATTSTGAVVPPPPLPPPMNNGAVGVVPPNPARGNGSNPVPEASSTHQHQQLKMDVDEEKSTHLSVDPSSSTS